MKALKQLTLKIGLATILSLFASSAFATGATLTILLASTAAVPTLSGWMLIIMSLLLFTVGVKVAKQKKGNAGNFLILVIGVTALGGGGIKLLTDVQASGLNIPLMPGTETYQLLNIPGNPDSGYMGGITNDSGQAVTVVSIEPDATSSCVFLMSVGPGAVPTPCDGLAIPLAGPIVIADGEFCTVQCALAGVISDRRLKQDINYLTKLENGIKLYSFKYISNYASDDTHYVGVMAQDLLQEAVFKNSVVLMDNNYYAVKYHELGLKMITLAQWQQSPQNILATSTYR